MIKSGLTYEELLYTTVLIICTFVLVDKFAFESTLLLSACAIFLVVKKKGLVRINVSIFVFVFFIVLLFIQIILQPSPYFSLAASTKDIQRFIIYVIITLVVSNCKIRERLFLRLWDIVFLTAFLVAVFQFFKLFGVNIILERIYGESLFLNKAIRYSSITQFRGGSIFINPNSYAKFILVYLAILLSIKRRYIERKGVLIFNIITVCLSLVLAGSRTGLLISLLLLSLTIVSEFRTTRITLMFLITSILLIVTILVLVVVFTPDLINFRIFKILSGVEDSLGYKFYSFTNMLREVAAPNVFIGLGRFEIGIWGMTSVDFDIGYLVLFYGIAGSVFYFLMLMSFRKAGKPSCSEYAFLNKLLIFIIVAFGLTGGVLFNLRFFSLVLVAIHTVVSEDRNSQICNIKTNFG